MFRRAFWFTAGAAAGVWATTRVQRKVRALQPDALAVRAADRAAAGGHRVAEFARDVRAGMARRESELHDALGLTGDAAYAADEPLGAGGPFTVTSARRVSGVARPAEPGPARLVAGEPEDERTSTDGVG